jgi:tRNA C32,U32 (ribose-2'-O)-methylase TrmJ
LRKNINIDELKTIDINNIKDLTQKEKEKIYKELKTKYQQINFLNPDDELYYSKLKLKQTLIKLAPNNEKLDLLNSSLYDFKDIINFKKYNYLKDNLLILVENI